jgi:tellurite resistance protein TerC
MTDSILLYGGFTAGILALLALDLGVFHRKSHSVSLKEALTWSAVWIGLAIAFNAGIWAWKGPEKGLEFLTGYLIEKALSVDNIFVFLVIFSYFKVPPAYQHKVLFWGILGALIMRAIMIAAGAALIQRFHAIIYVFGGFLILTGIKLALQKEGGFEPDRNPIVRLFKRLMPVTPDYREDRFMVVEGGRRWATPLLLVLVVVEATDLVFAVDSIPAIFAVTPDPFIVYTSNIFAILGLRALYFALAGVMGLFHYLKMGLAVILVFVGVKMLVMDVYKIPVGISLGIVGGILAASVAASLLWPPRKTEGPVLPQGPA